MLPTYRAQASLTFPRNPLPKVNLRTILEIKFHLLSRWEKLGKTNKPAEFSPYEYLLGTKKLASVKNRYL